MKILHATEVSIGGTITVIKHLIGHQVKNPQNSIILLSPHNEISKSKTIKNSNFLHITYARTGRNIKSIYLLFIRFFSTVWRENPDIVHIHSSFAGIVCRLTLLLLKPFRRPIIIYCPHGYSFLMDGSHFSKKKYSLIENLLSRISDITICVSHAEKSAAARAGITKNIEVIHNGVPIPKETNYISPYDDSKINYLFVGRLDKAKGFDIAANAFKSVTNKNISLTVIGISSTEVSSAEEYINIVFKGWLEQPQIAPYFQHADALVLSSRWEGFPMVVLEAMSFGLPVISSNCTSLPEVVKNNINGYLFETSNSDALAAILRDNSKHQLGKYRVAAKETFLEGFTVEHMVLSVDRLYIKHLKRL